MKKRSERNFAQKLRKTEEEEAQGKIRNFDDFMHEVDNR